MLTSLEIDKMPCHPILIVEDEPDLRETLGELLELEGFGVAMAANGQEALQYLREIGQSCLILLDLMMPVMNGWQFLEALREMRPHMVAAIPVVVISAAADVTDVQQQYGCLVMKKPVNLKQLIALAHEHCEIG